MLGYSTHPAELVSLVMLLPFIVCLMFKEALFPSKHILIALAVWLLVCLVVEIHLQIKYKKHWPRYKKHEPPGHALPD